MCKPSSSLLLDAVTGCDNKKQVRFHREEKLEERFEVDAPDQDEKIAKWMTRADFIAIQVDVHQALQESVGCASYSTTVSPSSMGGYEHNNDDNDEKCFRGLEPIVSSFRRVEIQSFIQDILEMQEECKMLGVSGLTGLQCFSENNSKSALKRALQLANQDACEARRVYAEALGSAQ